MSKSPLTVYLEGATLSALDERAAVLGKTRSGWAAQILERALGGTTSSYDEVILEQQVRCRALLEELVDGSKNPAERKVLRDRVSARFDKFLAAAWNRIGR